MRAFRSFSLLTCRRMGGNNNSLSVCRVYLRCSRWEYPKNTYLFEPENVGGREGAVRIANRLIAELAVSSFIMRRNQKS